MNNKYIKKSVEIEAIQWNGNNTEEIINFIKLCTLTQGDNLIIPTLEGDIKASVGDYIIKGIKGEYYPCKPDIFELTYEKVYTLEEVKKEWKDRGCCLGFSKELDLWTVSEGGVERIIFYDDKTYTNRSMDTSFELHNLITKTIKVLGWFE